MRRPGGAGSRGGRTVGGAAVRRRGWAVLVLASVAGMAATPAIGAERGGAPAASIAQAGVMKPYRIPAQPLAAAIEAFSDQSGIQVAYTTADLRGLDGNAVTGSHSAREALRLLLAGTGVTWRFTGERTVVLEKPDASGAVLMNPVTVEGEAENARGPVGGYVAKRSATGLKTDTPLLETPQSVSVVTREQMTDQGAQNVDQALRYTPGVVTENQGVDNRFDSIYLRGFSADEYLDGLKFLGGSFAVPQVDPYALERVEVLRGPASVLYGQASPGGLVNMVSKRPTATPLREALLQFGSYGRMEGGVDVGGPVDDEGQFRYRVTALAYQTDTQVDYTEYQRYFVAPALTWKPTDKTTLTLLAHFQKDPKAGFFNLFPATGTALANPNGQIPTSFYAGEPDVDKFDRTLASVGYEFEHRFNDMWSVRQNFRYLDMDSDFDTVYATGLQADLHTLTRSHYVADEDLGVISLDNQAQATFDTWLLNHRFLAGADVQRKRWDMVASFGTAPTIDYLNPVYGQTLGALTQIVDQQQTQYQVGVYAQDQVKLGNLSVVLGGRHDWAGGTTTNNMTGVATNQSDRALTGRAGVVYAFDTGIAPYFSYTQSFQPATGTAFDGSPFEPTTGTQYEAGVRYQPKAFDALFSAAVYDLTQQNVLTTDPVNTGFNVQTGEVSSRGVELEARATPLEGLSLIASYAYVDAEVTKANDGTQGKRPVGIPANLASAWADYTLPGKLLRGLRLGGGLRYRGTSYGNTTNTFKIDAVTLVDAAVHYDLGALDRMFDGVELAVNASNLLDKVYVGRCQNNGCYYGLRRNVFGTVTYRW